MDLFIVSLPSPVPATSFFFLILQPGSRLAQSWAWQKPRVSQRPRLSPWPAVVAWPRGFVLLFKSIEFKEASKEFSAEKGGRGVSANL